MSDVSRNLVTRWQAGDERAADELFQRYADRLIGLAQSRLSCKMRRRVDAEDVIQSACRSFFVGVREGRYNLEQGGDLWRLLVAITLNKIQDQVKRHKAGKRSIEAECGFGTEDSLHGIFLPHLAEAPSPLAAVALADEVEQLMRQLSRADRDILELRLQGHTLHEITDRTGRSLPTICRVLDRVKRWLAGQRS